MTPRWDVEFYEGETGCPVRDFLDGLERHQRAKVLAVIRLLEEQGPTLPFPYSSQIRGKLRELRTRSGDNRYRVLYFGNPKRIFILLHGFSKRTDKTPPGDIAIAEARMKRYLQQHEEDQREKP